MPIYLKVLWDILTSKPAALVAEAALIATLVLAGLHSIQSRATIKALNGRLDTEAVQIAAKDRSISNLQGTISNVNAQVSDWQAQSAAAHKEAQDAHRAVEEAHASDEALITRLLNKRPPETPAQACAAADAIILETVQ